jgi:hypothetical protein
LHKLTQKPFRKQCIMHLVQGHSAQMGADLDLVLRGNVEHLRA